VTCSFCSPGTVPGAGPEFTSQALIVIAAFTGDFAGHAAGGEFAAGLLRQAAPGSVAHQARPVRRTSNEARQSGRLPRAQHTKLTTVGIGHDHLADLALADVDASRPEGDETAGLLFLIPVDGWREIEM